MFIDTKRGDKLPAKVILQLKVIYGMFSVEQTTKDRDKKPSDSER